MTAARKFEPIYQMLSNALQAKENCAKSDNSEWLVRWQTRIDNLMQETAPSGSGIDSGTQLDDFSTSEKLVFHTSFHHMDESGCYDGWTDHGVTVKASLLHGIDIRITGRNRNDIKDYLHDVFHSWLTSKAVWKADDSCELFAYSAEAKAEASPIS
jgi:hypothetical protein